MHRPSCSYLLRSAHHSEGLTPGLLTARDREHSRQNSADISKVSELLSDVDHNEVMLSKDKLFPAKHVTSELRHNNVIFGHVWFWLRGK